MGGSNEFESQIATYERRIIELTQVVRDLARDEIDVRLGELYRIVQGDMSLLNARKKVILKDGQNILTSYGVIEPLRDLLLENNPEGELEIEIIPPHPKFGMSVRNPRTGSWILIGAGVRPYASPLFPSGRSLSPTETKAMQYREGLKGDDFVAQDFYNVKKLIGAVKQIAAFDNKLQV